MKKKFCIIFLSIPAFAYAGASEGLITQPLATEQGIFMFSAGTHLDKPVCSTQGDSWALNVSTTGGKSMQVTVLAAHAQGKRLHVVGKGICDAWGDREAPSYLYIID